MGQVFDWPITVYYEDTDAGGVVYHANYLKFFERARTEILRAFGFSQQRLLEQHIGFVVRSASVDFIRAARLDDQLTVKTSVVELKKVSLTFCQELVNPNGQLLCKALVKVACIDNQKMRPTGLPQSMILEFTHSDC